MLSASVYYTQKTAENTGQFAIAAAAAAL